MGNIIRLKSVKLQNIKNVKNGKIELPQSIDENGYVKKSDVLGIYGQNGSGKTAVIEALNILKILISKEQLPSDNINLISKNEKKSELEYEFYVFIDGRLSLLRYRVTLEKVNKDVDGKEEETFIISAESLYFLELPRGKGSRYKVLIDISTLGNISPKQLENHIMLNEELRINFKMLSQVKKFDLEKNQKSIIFAEAFSEEVLLDKFKELKIFIDALQSYGEIGLTIVDNVDSGVINANFIMPLQLHIKNDEGRELTVGKIGLYLDETNELTENNYILVQSILKKLNIVLRKIIPELEVTTKEISSSFNEQNMKMMKFQLFSKTSDMEIPLKYESDGIKKIISILSSIIMVYNDPNYCLVVDELDAGIFEYLLGEILEIVAKYGKGQLIFTSHNLRPLEVLNKENLIFTTTDRENNYVQLSNIKITNNIRNVYMKKIVLGSNDDKAELYRETDSYEIKKAFRIAGRESNG